MTTLPSLQAAAWVYVRMVKFLLCLARVPVVVEYHGNPD